RHMVFRTAWVYGAHGHNFMRTMLRLGAERDELRVVADQVGTPTPAGLIARATAQALRAGTDASGLWHLTATGGTSWHGFAEAIFAAAVERGLLPKAPRLLPIATEDYPTPARRPAYSRLDTARVQADFGLELPGWAEALPGVLDEMAATRAGRQDRRRRGPAHQGETWRGTASVCSWPHCWRSPARCRPPRSTSSPSSASRTSATSRSRRPANTSRPRCRWTTPPRW